MKKIVFTLSALVLSFSFAFAKELANSTFSMSKGYIDGSLTDKEKLSKAIRSQTDEHSFHLFSHGKAGALLLSNQWLSGDDLVAFIQPLVQGKTQLHIYGCHFAQGEKGRTAASYLETALGISVAASDDITGVDGDWDLEVGNIRELIKIPDYQYNLQTICSGGDLELDCESTNCNLPYPNIGAYPIVNGRDNNFAVFIGGDLNITGGKEIEGKSFIYGDFNFLSPGGSYNAGYVGLGSGVVPDDNTTWVTVGGDLNTNGTTFIAAEDAGGDAGEGTVLVKGTADPNDFIAGNGILVIDPILDLSVYDACFATINTQSQCWATEASSSNGTYADDGFGSYNFTSTDGASGLYVFNVTADMGCLLYTSPSPRDS